MKTTLTHQEMLIAVRAHYKLPEDTEIVIEGFPQDDGWISNIGRDKYGYPETLSPDAQIEVKLRNGETFLGYVYTWNSVWCEIDNDPCDIVAYRVIK